MNEPLSAITHLIAALFSIPALVLMVVYAALNGDALHIVGSAVFGSSLILLYTSSTVYHFLRRGTWVKELFRKIDHSMIYVLIAGTYTAICLGPLRGPWGWTLLGISWVLAVIGIILKSLGLLKGWLSAAIYVLMGWIIMIAAVPLTRAMSMQLFAWLLVGGLSYTLGVIFFGLDSKVRRSRWFGMHEIFHLFVIAGSFCHFWVIFSFF